MSNNGKKVPGLSIPMFVPADMLVKAGGWGNMIQSILNMMEPVLDAARMSFYELFAKSPNIEATIVKREG